ncbi:MAG TPA: apolipoprotein N-acyltransferase [Aquabacterium sp.]|nr:apolipoprotein N-acyltransferase [Aquabacterium sp.]
MRLRRIGLRRPAELVLAAALGALQTLAFVHTGTGWLLQLAAVAWLAWRVLGDSTPRRAAGLGLAFASAWSAAGTWWLFISMHRYGGLAAPLAVAAVLLLSLALALYFALALAAVARGRRGRPLPDALLFALAWLAAELARGLVFTGFPWVASGYAHVDSPLAGWAPWIGVYGLGALLAFTAALVAGLARDTRRAGIALAATVALAWLLPLGLARIDFTQASASLQVRLLQTNVAQDEKFVLQHLPATLGWLASTLKASDGDLVVAPETAVPLLPEQLDALDPDYWPSLREHFAQPGRPAALLGVPLGDERDGYSNAVVGLSAGGAAVYRYDKSHLVPFGEFIPTGFRWFTDLMNIPLGDFMRGRPDAPSFSVRGERIGPNICYEDLFGEELALRFTNPAEAPTVLANVSNIGWFGDTIAVEQHLHISRMRSLELQRPMLRATNTGATAVIDHRGRVTASLPPFTRGVLAAEVQGRHGRTPYAAWVGATGLWPLLVLAWLLLLLVARRRR